MPYRESSYTAIGTYHVIRSSPYSERDWAEASDADAPADEWDEAEYNRQMRVVLTKNYEGKVLIELRRMCKRRKLKVRGNKDELAARLARDDVEKMYGNRDRGEEGKEH